MNGRSFEIMIDNFCQEKGEANIRFFSEYKCELRIKDVKFYYQPEDYLEPDNCYTPVYLDNSYKTVTYNINAENKVFKSINFIVIDITNKKQFAVRIPISDGNPKYTEMLFENM